MSVIPLLALLTAGAQLASAQESAPTPAPNAAPAAEPNTIPAPEAAPAPEAPPAPEPPVVAAPPANEAPPAPVVAPAPAAPVAVAAKPKTTFAASGVYTIWNLSQHNFLLGREVEGEPHPLDDAGYTVQMLRAKLDISRGTYGVVTRFDAAQGWWGVDDDPNVGTAVTTDADGNVTGSAQYNPNALFGNKDANHALHVDLAYVWAEFGPVRVQAGRMYYTTGHLLVLDDDFEGVQATLTAQEGVFVDAMWAKVSEGRLSGTTPAGTLMSDAGGNSDADLFGLRARLDRDAVDAELFGLYWHDDITADDDTADWSFFPNGLGYVRSRYAPNMNRVLALGLAGSGKLGKQLEWKAEADYLMGEDLIDNADHAGGMLDVNDGDLVGWNGYADVTYKADVGVPADVGAIFGIGSGDADPTGGSGNINHISTMGFFPFLNVWEDSVMPDVEGISPQGLGSPVSRGYREFENTTAVAGRIGVKPVKELRLEVVGAWLKATSPVRAFDATGVPGDASATDLGWEIDGNATVDVRQGLQIRELFGYFAPGQAAAYLINGNDDTLDPAWELKTEVIAKF